MKISAAFLCHFGSIYRKVTGTQAVRPSGICASDMDVHCSTAQKGNTGHTKYPPVRLKKTFTYITKYYAAVKRKVLTWKYVYCILIEQKQFTKLYIQYIRI